MRTFSKLEGQV